MTDRVRIGLGLVAMAVAGAVGLAVAWRGVAGTLDVWVQVPFLASGAVGGVALAGAAIGLLSVHTERQSAADERDALDNLVHEAADLAEAMRHQARS